MMVYNSQIKAMQLNFPEKFSFREVTRTQFGPKLCNLLSYDFLFEDCLKRCSMKEYSWQTIVTVNFAKKIYFEANGQFKSNLGQNYPTFHLMIGSKNLFEMFQLDGAYQIDINDDSQFFPKNCLLGQMNNLGSNLPRFSATFSIMIYSDNLFKVLSSMRGQKK